MTARPALAALILAAAFAQAETSDELLSAQAAFRQALSEQNSIGSKLTFAEEKLTNARQRKAAAEADIQTYTQQLEQMRQQKAANDTALQQAGERLNAAWQAAHGSR
ncbi:TPA: hypothetical protein ACFNMI_000230 [Neisseria bacilliformis]|jgi:putative periplasmic protein|uniref:hypothetical protein n=1 Tax=Neisseria bacilliformis TaxID=267212 RepID=UPI0028EA60EA|nr:hypothetical protein [Neisseria bacilliformis]